MIKLYDATKAVEYAHNWAFSRNPKYFDFTELGGDCTNFASQVIFAGSKVMNYTPTFGWYYISINKRAPAWTGVEYLYNFLTTNKGAGPFAHKVNVSEVSPGDIVQISFNGITYKHSPVIVKVGENPSINNILVTTHTDDSDNRPLNTYSYKKLRFLHIDGVRTE